MRFTRACVSPFPPFLPSNNTHPVRGTQTTIGDFTEDVVTFAKDKNPSVKSSTLLFYTRCLSTTPSPPLKADLPPLIEAFKKTLEDSDAGVRSAAADVLGTLSKVLGERAFNALVGEMDSLRREKVKEAEEKAVVKCKGGVSAASASKPPPPAPAARAPPAKKLPSRPPPSTSSASASPAASAASSPAFDNNGFEPLSAPAPKRAPPARLAPKKPPSSASAAPAAAKKPPPSSSARPPPSSGGAGGPLKIEPLKPKYSQESAESVVESGESIPPEIVANLGDGNWKQRLEGMEKLSEWVREEGRERESEVVVRWLVGKKPGAKESNFQVRRAALFVLFSSSSRFVPSTHEYIVSKVSTLTLPFLQVAGKVFALLQQLATDSPSWTKACSAAAIPLLCDKLGDIKLKKPAADAMAAFAEKSSAGFVLSQGKQRRNLLPPSSFTAIEAHFRRFAA